MKLCYNIIRSKSLLARCHAEFIYFPQKSVTNCYMVFSQQIQYQLFIKNSVTSVTSGTPFCVTLTLYFTKGFPCESHNCCMPFCYKILFLATHFYYNYDLHPFGRQIQKHAIPPLRKKRP